MQRTSGGKLPEEEWRMEAKSKSKFGFGSLPIALLSMISHLTQL